MKRNKHTYNRPSQTPENPSGEEITQLVELTPARELKTAYKRITASKQAKFLSHYAKTGNFTLSAEKTGFTRHAFYLLSKRDEKFAEQLKRVKNHFGDAVEECLITLAMQPDPRTFKDRQLWLQANRPEKYAPRYINNHEHKHVHEHTIKLDSLQLKEILHSQNLASLRRKRGEIPETVDYKEIENATK